VARSAENSGQFLGSVMESNPASRATEKVLDVSMRTIVRLAV
jgi:hypothetical protein